jgi:hypothetical protein
VCVCVKKECEPKLNNLVSTSRCVELHRNFHCRWLSYPSVSLGALRKWKTQMEERKQSGREVRRSIPIMSSLSDMLRRANSITIYLANSFRLAGPNLPPPPLVSVKCVDEGSLSVALRYVMVTKAKSSHSVFNSIL